MTIVIDKLIRSNRKTIAIVVDKYARVIVRSPMNVEESYIRDVVRNRQEWIAKKRNMMLAKPPREERVIEDGTILTMFEKDYTIRVVDDAEWGITHSKRIISIDRTVLPDAKQHLPQVIKFLAKPHFHNITLDCSIKMGIDFNKVKVSDASRQWGSCSTLKNINLNWKLAFAPLSVLEYVAVHELAHIKEMNHSRKFWSIVGKYVPDYKEKIKWLKENAHTLEL